MPASPTRVFVYGTLTDAERADALLDTWRFDGSAVLVGCHRVVGQYPTLVPGGETDGTLLVTPEIDALDAYEGVDDGLYVRVGVPVADDGEAWVYVGDPGPLDAPARWPGEGPFRERVRRYVGAETVCIRRSRNR
jgi:gamma-glutamylcyclotransferase (GGCT)/AIG2-like uncharacterized protein YtfP